MASPHQQSQQENTSYFSEHEVFLATNDLVLRAGCCGDTGFGIPKEIVVAVQPPSEAAQSDYFGYPTCVKNSTHYFKRDGRSLRPEAIKIIVPRCKDKEVDKSLFYGYTKEVEEDINMPRNSKNEKHSSISPEDPNLGDITFSLDVIHGDGLLTVRIMQARDIPVRDFSGTVDAYVELYLVSNPDEKHHTRVIKANKYPKFNETFFFHVPFPLDDTLCLLVVDFDMFSRHQVIGEVRTSLKEIELIEGRTETLVKPIEATKTTVFRGDILCCLTLQVSKITVCIIKARKLKAGDLYRPFDSLVKVTLYNGKTKVKTKKTSVRVNTRDPVFNESAVFDISDISFENILIRITVFDYSDKEHTDIIGVCDIGSMASNSGANHWNEMINKPGNPFIQWHKLINSPE